MLVYLHSAEIVSFANLKKNIQKLISTLASIIVSLPARLLSFYFCEDLNPLSLFLSSCE